MGCFLGKKAGVVEPERKAPARAMRVGHALVTHPEHTRAEATEQNTKRESALQEGPEELASLVSIKMQKLRNETKVPSSFKNTPVCTPKQEGGMASSLASRVKQKLRVHARLTK